jgi:hypothetical protein
MIVLVIFEKLPRFRLSFDRRQVFGADHTAHMYYTLSKKFVQFIKKCSPYKGIIIGKLKRCIKQFLNLFLFVKIFILPGCLFNYTQKIFLLALSRYKIQIFKKKFKCNEHLRSVAWAWKLFLTINFLQRMSEMNKRIMYNNFLTVRNKKSTWSKIFFELCKIYTVKISARSKHFFFFGIKGFR